jgi:Helix-turn-helix domain
MSEHDPVKAYHPLVRWARWVKAGVLSTLSPSAGDVGQTLAAFESTEGRAYPSAKTIARLTGHTRNTVFAALQELKAHGVVEAMGKVQRRDSNANGPVIYRLRTPPVMWSLCRRDPSTTTKANPVERFTSTKVLSKKGQASLSPRDGDSISGDSKAGLSSRDTEGSLGLEVSREARVEGGMGDDVGTSPSSSSSPGGSPPSTAIVPTTAGGSPLRTSQDARAARDPERIPRLRRFLQDPCWVSEPDPIRTFERTLKVILKSYSREEVEEALDGQPEAALMVDRNSGSLSDQPDVNATLAEATA